MVLLLALAAGLATGIGGLIALMMKKVKNFIPASLGLAAGVMVYVAFVELYPAARASLNGLLAGGEQLAAAAFFTGALLMALLSYFVPEKKGDSLTRAGLFAIVAVALHNIPEGVAMFVAGVSDARLGASLCFAIALHNIPEGIAIAAPLSARYGGKRAALAALACGLFEPLGALVGSAFAPLITPLSQGVMLAMAAGVMVFLSLAEIIPSAAQENLTACSAALLAGMGIMAVALALV